MTGTNRREISSCAGSPLCPETEPVSADTMRSADIVMSALASEAFRPRRASSSPAASTGGAGAGRIAPVDRRVRQRAHDDGAMEKPFRGGERRQHCDLPAATRLTEDRDVPGAPAALATVVTTPFDE